MKPKPNLLSLFANTTVLMMALCGTASLMIPEWTRLAAANPDTRSTASSTPIFVDNGAAIRGTDPVAYFTEGEPVQGLREFAYEWEGATWLFASAEHRDRFADNPRAYAPQYGGFCAYGLSYGALVSTMPDAWSIVDGKLYLNYSIAIQNQWKEDTTGNIDRANLNWLDLSSK
ncbi:YHS domain-containing (seleno)protein [Acaryochloris marina]|nr:YHS domain-containing (seleno)protein [Acaryochloris marina]